MSVTREPLGEEHSEYVQLVFLGSPLLDITTDCDPTLLEKYSLRSDGCILANKIHDSLFEELFCNPKSRLDAGGSALNSAKIAKWALGEKAHVAFAGCVGQDEYASRLSEELDSSGVEPLFVSLPESNTGICACLLTPGGQRSMCTRLGAAAFFSKDHLDLENIDRRLHSADCVFVVGYFLAHSPEAVFDLANRCTQSQLFALSLSAEYICRDFKEALLDVLPKVDVLLGNEAEINAFATAIGMDMTLTSEEAACAIANLSRTCSSVPRIVIVTRGPEPVILVRGKESPRLFSVPQGVTVLDSVGCGDALAGAFLAIYVLTKDADRAIRTGIQAAVEIAQVPGCTLPNKKLLDLLDG